MKTIKQFLVAKSPLIEQFCLEVGRIALVAVVPVAISMLETKTIDWRALGIVGAVAALKGIDRALHETDTAEKGLVRF
jgi:hypothetical protein